MAGQGRLSNYELLRLMSMVFIVTQHYAGQTGWGPFELPPLEDDQPGSKILHHQVLVGIMTTGGKVGVNIFLMLSGYFLKGRGIKAASIARTWCQTLMWSWIIFGVFYFIRPMYWQDIRVTVLPIINYGYWFLSSYMGAVLATPCIAAAAAHTPAKQLVFVEIWLFWVMSLSGWFSAFCNVMYFMFGILVGATIRRFESKLARIPTRALAIALGVLVTISWYSVFHFAAYGGEYQATHGGLNALTRENESPLALFLAIVLFLLVSRWRVKSNVINIFAGCTLGVYLIHESQFVANPLWKEWLHAERWETHPLFPVIAVVQIAMIYTACTGLEYLRQWILGPVEQKMVDIFTAGINFVDRRVFEPILGDADQGDVEMGKVARTHPTSHS